MRRTAIALLFITQITAQNSFNNRFTETASSIFTGFSESLEWYDVPIGAAYFSRQILSNSNLGDMIIIPPTSYEIDLNRSFSVNNGNSPGSMNKDLIPHAIFLGRLSTNLLLDLFTERDISSSPYSKAFLFQKSLIYTYTITELAKNIFKRTRPDNTDNRSFFSGHTSTTFAAATFLYLELKDIYNNSGWLKDNLVLHKLFQTATFAGLYGWAGYVGYCRIKDNRHYLSDVLIGATIGTLMSFLVYDEYLSESSSTLDNVNIYSIEDTLLLSFSLSF